MAVVEVLGEKRLISRVTQLAEAMDPAALAGVKKVTEQIRDKAKEDCPVGTPESTGIPGYVGGSLKASIRTGSYAKPAGHVFSIRVTAGGYVTNPNTGNLVDYALHVEFGTSKMAPRPFFVPAVGEYGKELARAIKEALLNA